MKRLFLISLLVLMLTFISCKEDINKLETMNMKEIDLNEYYAYLEESGKEAEPFEITFIGDTEQSPESKKNYIYFEAILYYGGEVVESTYRILYNREGEFQFVVKDLYKVNIHWRKLRPYIDDIWVQEYNHDNLETAPASVREVFEKKQVEKAKLIEVGMEKDRKYYAKFSKDTYYLPPSGPEGKPRKKTNLVLMISDKPFKDGKPQAELSPLFQEWTY